MAEQQHVKLSRNGRNQAVRIPVGFELPGDEAIMHREGDRLVIEPIRKRGLIALVMQTGRKLPIAQIFQEFKNWRDASTDSLEFLLFELKRYAAIFRKLITRPATTEQRPSRDGSDRSIPAPSIPF